MVLRTKILDVTRKPSKCPVCGGRVVDIIYGTGDMTEIEFVMKYRRDGIMEATRFLVVLLSGHASVDAADSGR